MMRWNQDSELAELLTFLNADEVNSMLQELSHVMGLTKSEIHQFCKGLITKNQQYGNTYNQETPSKFWSNNLTGEKRIAASQTKDCKIVVLVPVHNEKVDRIQKLLRSITAQKDIKPTEYEVILVVNNGLPFERKEHGEIMSNNSSVIAEVKRLKASNIHVIDKSSAGNEIPHCNVGKARNRALAEATIRFFESGKNGIIIHTDADTYYEDVFFFAKAVQLMNDDDIIGASGGVIFEFTPDDSDPTSASVLRAKLGRYILKKKWDSLILLRGRHINENIFYGPNMVSRSYESAAVGGFIDANLLEDTQFGMDLLSYAKKTGKRVVSAKSDLVSVTSIRDSQRTVSTFSKSLRMIDLNKPEMVMNPKFLGRTKLQTFMWRLASPLTSRLKIELTESSYQSLEKEVLRDPLGIQLVNHINQTVAAIRMPKDLDRPLGKLTNHVQN